jgi:hypothetical protein
LIKKQINIDETWPVFSLDEPKQEDGLFVVEINEEFYKEYLYFHYKYHEYQLRLQAIYEHKQREVNDRLGYRFPEGTECCREFEPNKIRSTDVAETSI